MNPQHASPSARISLVGTGFVSRGLVSLLQQYPWVQLAHVLTRRNIQDCTEYPRQDLLTNSLDQLIDNSDLVIECAGDVVHATAVVDQVIAAGLPVVTMDAEFHATTGSYFVPRGILSEGEGDQPGSLAALKEEAEMMGFQPLVYGNIKWFLNHNPTPEEMHHWSNKLGISLTQVTSFTDGTKLQLEQTLVANGLGADIAVDGLIGRESANLEEGAEALGVIASHHGKPISDYIRAQSAPPGVFIVANHQNEQAPFLKYYKMGDGPFYTITRPYHLCHIELPKTVRRILDGGSPLLNNSALPRVSVVGISKRPLMAGYKIKRGIGSFDVRGIAIQIADDPDHVPIGLLSDAVVKHNLEPGQRVRFEDVDLPDSTALTAWRTIRENVLQAQE